MPAVDPSKKVERIVQVRLFARAKEVVGRDILTVSLPEGITIADLRRLLAVAYPALGSLLEHSALAIGDEFASDGQVVPLGAEIALLPPVSGGSGECACRL